MKKMFIICLLICCSCKSYYIDVISLKEQLKTTKAVPDTRFEQLDSLSYLGSNLSELKVQNKKGKKIILETENSIILKVERKDGFKFRYYLNSMLLNGESFYGMGPTYLVGGLNHRVPMDSIVSIKAKP